MVLPENPGPIPSTHTGLTIISNYSSRGSDTFTNVHKIELKKKKTSLHNIEHIDLGFYDRSRWPGTDRDLCVSASLIRSKGLHLHAQLIRAIFNLKSINISWEYSSVIEILPAMHRALVSILSTQKGREIIRDIKLSLSQQKNPIYKVSSLLNSIVRWN